MSAVLLIIFAVVSGLCMLSLGPMVMAGRSEAMVLLLILVTQLFPLRGIAGFAAVSHHKKRITRTAVTLLLMELGALLVITFLPYLSMKLFISAQGDLCCYADIYSLAGADCYTELVNLTGAETPLAPVCEENHE